ncbi:MAG TPA: hypothetical protein PL182_04120, partial [Pseudobdellovibrionaceae bacterium]|nr:hypothetical protein [Pseudobdellovibrionaceae bacterium]
MMRVWDRWRRVFAREPDPMGLNEILAQLDPQVDLPERQERLVQLLRWLFQGGSSQIEARFRFFFRALSQQAEWQKNLAQVLDRTIRECDWLRFYSEVGLTIEHGPWADLANRTLGQFLPVGNRHDFYYVVAEAWGAPEAREALGRLSGPTLNQIGELLAILLPAETWALLEEKRRDAIFYLATHIAHYGLSSSIQRRVPNPYRIAQSPFYRLSQNLEELPSADAKEFLSAAREELRAVYDHLDQNGVSVDIVNRLETTLALISRLEVLIALRASVPAEKPQKVREFLVSLATAIEQSTSISGYLARHFYLLARKIVERNGHSGEHYIARNSPELRSLFYSSIGGGVIVVGMTIFKILFLHRNPPLLIMALGLWTIYAGGFLMMQFTGTTLATKIPSFTASRLAGYLKTTRQVDEAGFRLDVRQVLKSQSLALVGNFVGVIPVTLLVDWLLRKSFGG